MSAGAIVGGVGGGIAAVLGGILVYANLPTRYTIGAIVPTASYLASTNLIRIKDENNVDEKETIKASAIFQSGPTMVMAVRRPGCLLCRREAAHLSELRPIIDAAGINLIAVVHEKNGVNEFKPYFKGEVYYDKDKNFYGPNQRWLPIWMGFLRVGTYINVYKTKKEGFQGNMKGEGRLLGGVFLIANNEVVYAHLEKEWGDAANIKEVEAAIQKFKNK